MTEHMYLTTAELAEELRLSKGTVYQLVKNGIIPAVKLSCRKFLYNPVDVRAALRKYGVDYPEK